MATKSPRRAQPHSPVVQNGNNPVLKVHQGPLPDPQTLREYDDLIPGAAAYFTERDRWFRESVTDAVRLHS